MKNQIMLIKGLFIGISLGLISGSIALYMVGFTAMRLGNISDSGIFTTFFEATLMMSALITIQFFYHSVFKPAVDKLMKDEL